MLRPFSFPGRWLYQRQDTARFKMEPSVFGGDRLKGSASGWKPYPKCVLQLIA